MKKTAKVIPAWHGSLALTVFRESDRRIAFKHAMRVEWSVIAEESTGSRLLVEILFPNGMRIERWFSTQNPHPAGHLSAFTRRALSDAVRRFLNFEFMHSFFHPHEDPNYTMTNWAIYGNFKDDVILSGV